METASVLSVPSRRGLGCPIIYNHDHAVVCVKHGAGIAFAKIDLDDVDKVRPFRWCMMSAGYPVNASRKRRGLMHRLIMAVGPGQEVDHANRDRLDNRKVNLRFADRKTNGQNVSLRSDNTTGARGVFWCKTRQRWNARADVCGEKHLRLRRYFHTFDAANDCVRAWRAEHMPFSEDARVASG
jgi:hypothetical protein